jgi:hypothetical protein
MSRTEIERFPLSNYATYLKRLAESDISIAPLEDNVFNDAKSNIKYLEAASIRLPSVCSPSSAMRTAIQDGDTGFLAPDSATWERALLALVDDEALRATMADRAYRHVHADYAPDPVPAAGFSLTYRQLPRASSASCREHLLRTASIRRCDCHRGRDGAAIEQAGRRYFMFTTLPTSDVPATNSCVTMRRPVASLRWGCPMKRSIVRL